MGYTPHVLVIGGGAVGTGIARDLAIRGLDVTLVERGTLASGTTGRMDALLESGARLAETDPRMATYCLEESRTLSEIASHCIEDTGGLVVQHEDREAFERLQAACEECGIPATPLSGEEAREREPGLSAGVKRALEVPDAAIDPFRLAVANARDAQAYGAEVRPHTEVTDVLVENGSIAGVEVRYDPMPTGDTRLDETDDGDSEEEAEDEERGEDDGEGQDEETDDGADDEDTDSGADDKGTDDGVADEETDGEATDEDTGDGVEDEGTEDEADDSDEETDDEPETSKAAIQAMREPVRIPGKTTKGQIPGESSGSDDGDKPRAVKHRALEVTEETLDVDYVVNAAGADAGHVASMADLPVSLEHTREARLVGAGRQVETAVTAVPAGEQSTEGADEEREADWNSLVPLGTNCVLGTVDLENENGAATGTAPLEAVDDLLDSLDRVVPGVGQSRILRAFHGIRYRLSTHDRPAEHGHEFVLVDHADHHDCWGMTTVLGGSVTTHRLAAEHVSNQVCRKFGITRECRTADLSLPGGDDETFTEAADPATTLGLSESVYDHGARRLGSRANAVLSTEGVNPVVCECRSVTRAEIRDALADETATDVDLDEIRIRTAAAMGECQGGHCAHRLAAELHPEYDLETIALAGMDLLDSRWQGQCPRGPQLAQMHRNYRHYASTMNLKYPQTGTVDADRFDADRFDAGPGREQAGPGGRDDVEGDERNEEENGCDEKENGYDEKEQAYDEDGNRQGGRDEGSNNEGGDGPRYCPRPGGPRPDESLREGLLGEDLPGVNSPQGDSFREESS